MSRHPASPLVMALSLSMLLPQLSGCGGCQETDLSRTGSVAEDSGIGDGGDGGFSSSNWGLWLGSAILADGNIGITFYDKDQGGIAFGHGTPGAAGITWQFEEVDGYPGASGLDAGDRGMHTSLAVAPDGTAWAAFYDLGARNLRYAWRANTPSGYVWINGMADSGEGMTQDAGLFTSIAIDDSGNPVIAHHDKASGTLRVAHWQGSAFSGEVVDRGEDRAPVDTGNELVEASVGMYAHLQIANGQEYIAYYDAANGNLKLAIGNAPNYQIYVVDDDEDVGAWPSMAIRGRTIHIAYQDVGKQHLRYAVGKPDDWTITKVDRNELVGADTALFFDGDNPGIVYFDGYNNDMKVARYDGDRWRKSKVARSGAVGFHNEVVFAGGRFYGASYNYTKKTVLFRALD
jgi:hypothetical protein